MKYWIGLDIGTKWTGIAISNELVKIASPKKTVKTEHLIKELKEMNKEYDFKGIILGFPLTTTGKIGQRAKIVQEMKKKIQKELNIPVKLQDERFTTKEATKIASQLGKTKDKRFIDKISASLILKEFLDEN
ncbi:MAG: Holliday junction resolvase RuvX [candidate division WOR-3 bacterium]